MLLTSVLVTSCTGELRGESSDGGATDAPRAPGADAPALDAPGSACASIRCGAGAVCEPTSGRCVCGPGFVDVGGSCAPADPGEPATRSRDAVCALWVEGHRTTATSPWTEGATECEPGSMSRQALDDTLRRFDKAIGLARLKVIHANDSKREQGSRVDRHEAIGKGKIGPEAFRLLLAHPKLAGIPLILETPKEGPDGKPHPRHDRTNLATLRRLAAR